MGFGQGFLIGLVGGMGAAMICWFLSAIAGRNNHGTRYDG